MKKRKERKKKGAPRRASENEAEAKCKAAAEMLIADGRLDECIYDSVLDAVGIDFVLHKHVRLDGGRHTRRISLHLQIKQTKQAANEHCARYPGIPVFVILSIRSNIRHIAEELWELFCGYFREGGYGKYLAQRSRRSETI